MPERDGYIPGVPCALDTTQPDPEAAAGFYKGAQLVNKPGTLVFNGLTTLDVEGAKSFYGSVFGWQTLTLDGGAEMWTLPGYGDDLERDNPDLPKRLAEMGGPGYEDVVASLDPIPNDQPGTPAQWSVTFAVDDPGAAAAKASELGGTVIAPPVDAAWSRPGYYRVNLTIIEDPQGATFGASQFVPENRNLGSEPGVEAS